MDSVLLALTLGLALALVLVLAAAPASASSTPLLLLGDYLLIGDHDRGAPSIGHLGGG